LCITNTFNGVSIKEKDVGYALDFSLIADIEYMPLTINRSYDLIWEDRDNLEKGTKKLIEGLVYDFSLKEIIETVFYELSFHGSPEGVIEMQETLEERHEEMKLAIENRKKLDKQKDQLHNDLTKMLNDLNSK
jgi:hypothetical protein